MKSFKQFLTEDEKWAMPDYPEQVLAKDDPKGDWVTGDPPRPIDFPLDGNVKGIENTKKVLDRANKVINREREAQKPGKTKK